MLSGHFVLCVWQVLLLLLQKLNQLFQFHEGKVTEAGGFGNYRSIVVKMRQCVTTMPPSGGIMRPEPG